MPEDGARLRQKALRRMRQAKAAWVTLGASGFASGAGAARFLLAAGRAETALFRVICGALDDPGPRVAYGEIASLRSWVMVEFTRRLTATQSVEAARCALWALDRAELRGLDPQAVARLAEEPSVETEFTENEGTTGILYGEKRVAAAADTRFVLAERLAAFQPPPRADALTPLVLDVALRSREKFSVFDETLVWKCQLESCRGRDGVGEARILAREAADMFQVLADRDGRFGPNDASKAGERRDAILRRLPLYFD